MKNKNLVIYITTFILTIIFGFYFSYAPVSARIIQPGPYTSTILDSTDVKEQQLWEKVQVIKSIFGDAVDDVALASTIFYGESAQGVVSAEYDKDYKKEEYENEISQIKSVYDDASDDSKYNKTENSNMSKLLAATIVMVDSSFGTVSCEDENTDIENCPTDKLKADYDLSGKYSDEKYKYALMQSGLVGNMKSDCKGDALCDLKNAGLNAWNAFFCGTGATFDTLATPLQFTGSLLTGNALNYGAEKADRYVTMTNVCMYGYISGTNENIRSIKDESQQKFAKKKYAEGIINLANEYRYLFGEEQTENVCDTSATASDAANWRQCDDNWKNKNLNGGGTMCNIGCAATSLAYILKTSGTALKDNNFTPGVVADKGVFTGGGGIRWQETMNKLAPNFKWGESKSLSGKTAKSAASEISKVLNTKAEGKYKQFVIIQMTNHWVAVDHVQGNTIYVLDPAAKAGAGLVTLEDALNRGNTKRKLIDYHILYATDVTSGGGSGDNSSSTSDMCAGDFDTLIGFLEHTEGTSKCNYKGQGEGTGYSASDLRDGAGMTAGLGLTKYDAAEAKEIGYTSYMSDLNSGCISKEQGDLLIRKVVEKKTKFVENNLKKVDVSGLSQAQMYALVSIVYNTGGSGSYINIVNYIKKYGPSSYETFHCMVTEGCGWTRGGFADGLANRRAAEFEAIATGNLNAKKLDKGYSYYQSIDSNSKLQDYEKKYWPTSRKKST